MKLTEADIAILQAASDRLPLGVAKKGEWMCQGKEVPRKNGEALVQAGYLKPYRALRIITPAGRAALLEALRTDRYTELAKLVDLQDFKVVKETPTTVQTPHGRIGVSWQSTTDSQVEKRAEAVAALIEGLPVFIGQRKALIDLIETWEREAQEEPEGSPSQSVLQYCADCVRTVLKRQEASQ